MKRESKEVTAERAMPNPTRAERLTHIARLLQNASTEASMLMREHGIPEDATMREEFDTQREWVLGEIYEEGSNPSVPNVLATTEPRDSENDKRIGTSVDASRGNDNAGPTEFPPALVGANFQGAAGQGTAGPSASLTVMVIGHTGAKTRFVKDKMDALAALQRQGRIVIDMSNQFGELSRAFCDCVKLADELLVMNFDGVVEPHSTKAIAYAIIHGKPVRFFNTVTGEQWFIRERAFLAAEVDRITAAFRGAAALKEEK